MATPQFVLDLRAKIGHDLLWMMGVTGMVRRDDGRILLGRRSDTGEWAMVYGINEPGEQPADTVVREVKEETGVDVVVTDLVAVTSSPKVLTYANGDRAQYMDHSFLCALKPGGNAEPFVGDDESLAVGWFDLDDLPSPLAASTVERLALFRRYLANKAAGDAHALFVADGEQH
ncbi:NUDIX domain-containing protein [Bifidobacterium pullorum subsp. saeculare]|uniref:NUDIX domain-containing protein n=1 Tax=Bifidobacterium pullorum subsp. saeculare TaxID=78257 RepID=A0A939B911_9BIFI|nr:NUDIX domain-containing protein [Bifidobacterium pullorum]MBM6698959.1 NUDIX domain-containing protein [Bifidobacterium pullorum subsp. saeculare]